MVVRASPLRSLSLAEAGETGTEESRLLLQEASGRNVRLGKSCCRTSQVHDDRNSAWSTNLGKVGFPNPNYKTIITAASINFPTDFDENHRLRIQATRSECGTHSATVCF